jgi:hypothetical protein
MTLENPTEKRIRLFVHHYHSVLWHQPSQLNPMDALGQRGGYLHRGIETVPTHSFNQMSYREQTTGSIDLTYT